MRYAVLLALLAVAGCSDIPDRGAALGVVSFCDHGNRVYRDFNGISAVRDPLCPVELDMPRNGGR